jgi:hypothetical protein
MVTRDSLNMAELQSQVQLHLHCSCNLLPETRNFSHVHVLLLLVSTVQKIPSLGLELRTVSKFCDLCFCNFFTERNSFGLGAVLLLCLISDLQKPSSQALEPRIFFWSFDCCKIFSWFQGISMLCLRQISRDLL